MTIIWWKRGRRPTFYPVASHAFNSDYLDREALCWWIIPGAADR